MNHSRKREGGLERLCSKFDLFCPIRSIGLIVSFSEGDEQRMLLMGLKRFTKYQNYPNVIALRDLIAEKLKSEGKYCF